jgi:hypothetical protein
MRSQFTLHHLLVILSVAVVVVAVACGGSTVKSPTAATNLTTSAGSTSGTDAVPATAGTGGATTGGPGSSGTGASGSGATGTLSVRLKDSPFSEASALLVTFSEVSVHVSGSGTTDGAWMTLPFVGGASTRTCDLKRLVAATDVLGTAPLTAGHYTQLRLTVSSATIYKTTTTTGAVCSPLPTLSSTPTKPEVGISVDVSSGTLKLNREFDVPAGGATTILLDFDGDKSVHQTGNGKYKMTPVIGVVSVQ